MRGHASRITSWCDQADSHTCAEQRYCGEYKQEVMNREDISILGMEDRLRAQVVRGNRTQQNEYTSSTCQRHQEEADPDQGNQTVSLENVLLKALYENARKASPLVWRGSNLK